MRALLLAGLLFAAPAHAGGFYLDLGLGWAQGLVEDIHNGQTVDPLTGAVNTFARVERSPWLHGQIEIGYELEGGLTIFAQHTSSPLTTNDQGADVIGIRKRFWL